MVANHFGDSPPPKSKRNKVPCDETLDKLVVDALALEDERDSEEVRAYQSLVGALLYAATNTRPDIAYSVGMLCRAMAKPTP